MVKLVTGAEYLPPLPEELPDSVFPELEKCGCVVFAAEQRQLVSEAAYLLVDGMYRHASRPNAGEARERLEKLIGVLERTPVRDPDILWEQVRALLYPQGEWRYPTSFGAPSSPIPDSNLGDLAEALRSLLLPLGGSQTHVRTLSAEAREKPRETLLADAKALLCRLQARYTNVPGPEPAGYIDVYILRLAEIYISSGACPSASHSDERGGRDTPFVRLVAAVGAEALARFAPDVLAGSCATSERIRRSLKLGALEERVRVVLVPRKAEKRRARARKYSRRIHPCDRSKTSS
jgi:hypothetical protein